MRGYHCLLAVLFSVGPATRAQEKPIDVPLSQIGSKYRLIGKLHEPLGTVVTLQGVIVEGPSKGYEGGPNICVRRINGLATQEDIQIKLSKGWTEFGVDLPKLESGTTLELKDMRPVSLSVRRGRPWKNFGFGLRYPRDLVSFISSCTTRRSGPTLFRGRLLTLWIARHCWKAVPSIWTSRPTSPVPTGNSWSTPMHPGPKSYAIRRSRATASFERRTRRRRTGWTRGSPDWSSWKINWVGRWHSAALHGASTANGGSTIAVSSCTSRT